MQESARKFAPRAFNITAVFRLIEERGLNYSGRLMAAGLIAIAFLACAAISQDTSRFPYMNPKLSPEERAADMVHRMTIEEKASQLVNQARASVSGQPGTDAPSVSGNFKIQGQTMLPE